MIILRNKMFLYNTINNKVANLSKHILFRFCRNSHSNVDKLRDSLKTGPQFQHFLSSQQINEPFIVGRDKPIPYIDQNDLRGNGAKVHIRTYGCQMNVNDTQIASTILQNVGYNMVNNINDAEIIFLMTCAIRENAELKIWKKLRELSHLKNNGKVRQIGLLGCMAERLKIKLLDREKDVDIIAGPDSYRDLPKLIALNRLTAQNAVNVLLSLDETYSDILPTMTTSSMNAFVSIMRGCDNMCAFCIVPFTRGRERSRSIESIVEEVKQLSAKGIKEVTLLGQNVNSYRDMSHESKSHVFIVDGFKTIYKPKKGGLTFDILLDEVAKVDSEMRIRFTSPHPKDFPDEVLEVIKTHANIAKNIHLPAQSGSNQVLERMRRGYTREAYLKLVDRIRHVIPNCSLSSDFICGFCGETEQQHQHTLQLIEAVGYNTAFMFQYSMRERTHAFYKYSDDVPYDVKIRRLNEVNSLYRNIAHNINKSFIGNTQLILIEGESKRSVDYLYGRNEANIKVIIPKLLIPQSSDSSTLKSISAGDYVAVHIIDCTSITLTANPLFHTTLTDYYSKNV